MQANNIISAAPVCPRCEFRAGSAGKAESLGAGLWRCGECGGQWRVVGNPVSDFGDHGRARIDPAQRLDALDLLRPGARAGSMPRKRGRTGSAARPLLLAGAMVLALAAGWQVAALAGWSIGRPHGAGSTSDGLVLSALRAQKLMRGGSLAIRVEGRITNNSSHRQPIEPIDIVVAGGQGRMVGKWTHVPALRHLEPGQAIRFATAKGDIGNQASAVEIRFAGLTRKTGF